MDVLTRTGASNKSAKSALTPEFWQNDKLLEILSSAYQGFIPANSNDSIKYSNTKFCESLPNRLEQSKEQQDDAWEEGGEPSDVPDERCSGRAGAGS